MSARAGIVVTGTEVLSGIISDRNGPWLSERLRDRGIDLAQIVVVGDRPQDMEGALRYMAGEGVDLIVTSGGLGPTADDLTAEVVGKFCGRKMALDEALEGRIAEILRAITARWPDLDPGAIREGNRKQAIVPAGATILEPVGTAPGLVVPPLKAGAGPTVVVLPGPPRELQPMWEAAVETDAFAAAVPEATEFDFRIMRLFGIPESEIALTLREAQAAGLDLAPLEITTCLRRGEIEIATRFEPTAEPADEAWARWVAGRHADTLFSTDGATIDDQVAELLAGRLVATAESCTGGLLAARLTERPGSSAYVAGGVVAYANEAKTALAGVDPELVARHGAVSVEVAEALADGALDRFAADVGVGVTGVAGPGGGTEQKPVGFVCISATARGGERITRAVHLPGGRVDVRDRAVTVALHLLRRLLRGEP
ncbi:MAG: nicotinamide-nucleotide amidase [Solirubrobacteraceae bacterium]|nr:nicotinamide-nucleotide amidase [Solirubrobacteraceae bacterium]